MSSVNLPKAVLQSSPAELSDSMQGSLGHIRSQVRFHENVRSSISQAMNEVHQSRMKNLRKELDYLKETEWKYEPIEKYIGQNY